VDVTGGEPAGLKEGISSTPSNPAPVTPRRAASMARISAMMWPRSVESPRLMTSMGPPKLRPRMNRLVDTLVFSSTAASSGRLRVLVRMKQVDPGAASPAAYSSASKTVTTLTSCTVCEPVGSSSSTAIRRPAAALAALMRSRAPASCRTGGAAARTSSADGRRASVLFAVIRVPRAG
jgi:hypothetical protein